MEREIFVGREEEIQQLKDLLKKRSASFVVVKGRRRIGKSRLLDEFSKNKKTYKFTGLPPQKEEAGCPPHTSPSFHPPLIPCPWRNAHRRLSRRASGTFEGIDEVKSQQRQPIAFILNSTPLSTAKCRKLAKAVKSVGDPSQGRGQECPLPPLACARQRMCRRSAYPPRVRATIP